MPAVVVSISVQGKEKYVFTSEYIELLDSEDEVVITIPKKPLKGVTDAQQQTVLRLPLLPDQADNDRGV